MRRTFLVVTLTLISIAFGTVSCPARANDEAIKRAVRDALKDPDSAKFGLIKVIGDSACAQVNAKNAFGGYTGTQNAILTKIDKHWFSLQITDAISFTQCISVIEEMQQEKVAERNKKSREAAEEKAVLPSEEQKGYNEPCNSSASCGEGLVCKKHICTLPAQYKRIRAGGACEEHEDCAFNQGLMCIDHICKTPNNNRQESESDAINKTINPGDPTASLAAVGQNSESNRLSILEKSPTNAVSTTAVLECAAWLSVFVVADANIATRIEKDEWDDLGFFAKRSGRAKADAHPLMTIIKALTTKGGGEDKLKIVVEQSVIPEAAKLLLQIAGDYPEIKEGERTVIALPIIKTRSEAACFDAGEAGIRIVTISNLNAVKF